MTTPQHSLDQFKNRLAHAYVAYRYAVGAVPPESAFQNGPIQVGTFLFRSAADATSMRVELGWAFFVRMDAVLEYFLEASGQRTSGTALFDALSKGGELSADELEGAKRYRDLRNALHHDDGQPDPTKRKTLTVTPGNEPHLLPEHMAEWNALFLRIAEVVSTRSSHSE